MNKSDLEKLSPEERQKILELLNSKKDGDNGTKWMYEPIKTDSEEFLCGKKITDLKELAELHKKEDDDETPEQRFARMDMQLKFREDPLTLIKQSEKALQEKYLQNSIKATKLKKLIKKQKEKKKKHKKKKKKYRRDLSRSPTSSRSRSNSGGRKSEESQSSGDELVETFLSFVKKRHEKTQNSTGSREKSPKPSKDGDHSRSNRLSSSSVKHDKQYRRESNNRPKLSKEEIEKKRREMMNDAKVHGERRYERTKNYEKSVKEEQERIQNDQKSHGASFVKDMTLKHYENHSLQENLNRKTARNQRSKESKFIGR